MFGYTSSTIWSDVWLQLLTSHLTLFTGSRALMSYIESMVLAKSVCKWKKKDIFLCSSYFLMCDLKLSRNSQSYSFDLFLPTLTLSQWGHLWYRNQSTDLLSKSMDWFLYDRDLRRERVSRYWLWLFEIKWCIYEFLWTFIYTLSSKVTHQLFLDFITLQFAGNFTP